jgi:hypothetical protein
MSAILYRLVRLLMQDSCVYYRCIALTVILSAMSEDYAIPLL